jgi:hypothetical protein
MYPSSTPNNLLESDIFVLCPVYTFLQSKCIQCKCRCLQLLQKLQFCTVVQWSAIQCGKVQNSAVQNITVQCNLVQCSGVQYSAVKCNLVQSGNVEFYAQYCCNVVQ